MTCTKPPPGWTCSRNEHHAGACAARREVDTDIPVPEITTWDDAQRWIGYHHRMLVMDTQRMSRIEERLRRLERPWRRRKR